MMTARRQPSTSRRHSRDANGPVSPDFAAMGFKPGNLVRIKMVNFLTFKNTEVEPGPRLNLIIGPNGTGKSSIVNAVCIVFGGKLGLLGRSGDLGSFVRHGSREASVEVWIFDPDQPGELQRVKRQFDTDGKSEFFIAGKKCTVSAVTALSRRYDVQLDNLSQFMPQEKIAEFVNVKPQELLNITIRSLGGTERVEKYKELITVDTNLSNSVKRIQQLVEKIDDLKARNEACHAEVQAFREQRDIKKTIKLAGKILPHREAAEMHQDLLAHIEEKKALQRELEEIKERIKASKNGRLRELEQKVQATKDDANEAKQSVVQYEQGAIAALDGAEEIGLNLSMKKESLRDLDKSAERHENLVAEARRKVEECKQKFAQISAGSDEESDLQRQTEVRQQRTTLQNQIRNEEQSRRMAERARVDAERAISQLNRQIDSLGDLRSQRIRYLEGSNKFRGTGEALRIIEEIRQARGFRGNVYGPVLAEISCEGVYHARIMEGCVSGFLLGAFVTENTHDSRLLISECKRQMNGWSPDTITAPTLPNGEKDENALLMQVPERPVDDRLAQLGIVAMVSDIFQAPDAVRAALNAQAMLHTIHVGDERSEDNAEVLRYEQGIRTWYTPSARCAIVRSRYDSSVRNLRMENRFVHVKGDLYAGSMEQAQRDRARFVDLIRGEEGKMETAKAHLDEFAQRIAQIRESMASAERAYAEISDRVKGRRDLRDALQRNEQYLNNLMRKPNVAAIGRKKEAFQREIVELEKDAVEAVPGLVTVLDQLKNAMAELDECSMHRVVAERQFESEKEKSSSLHRDLDEAKQKLDAKKEEKRAAQKEWRKTQTDAEAGLPMANFPQYEETIGPWLDKSSEWLRDEMERLRGRMQGLTTMGPNVLQEYEDRQTKIAESEEQLKGEKENNSSAREAFNKEKEDFLVWLKAGVDNMRVKFSELYRRLGCSGDLEVTNVASDSLEDLELQILVSYREGAQLRPISASSNSGGEKMCCTMLFCFSLLHEEARMPPFVMVDELNQGLDPVNEMKIMTIMFEDAERGSAPQSFVVTPKLLPDLPFKDATKTHVIFNGSIFKGDVGGGSF